MLILSRRREAAIIIMSPGQPSVRVMVTAIEPTRVKLGVDAPEGVMILREELILEPEAQDA